jgi:7-keto-8-aminopelargonate synthetase-like enzyme
MIARPRTSLCALGSTSFNVPVIIGCRMTNKKIHVLNLGSYNYLGFANSTGYCADKAVELIERFGV